jgi:hypothetical protein
MDDDGPVASGRWYRLLAAVSVFGCVALIVIGMQPPNDKAAWIVGAVFAAMALIWFGGAKSRFAGPPEVLLSSSSVPPSRR